MKASAVGETATAPSRSVSSAAAGMRGRSGLGLHAVATAAAIALSASEPALAQTPCPSPAVVVNTQCTVSPGTTIAVTPAGAVGLNASGAQGKITGDGVTLNLNAVNTTGALAQQGAAVTFNGSKASGTLNGQIGLRATGSGSQVTGAGAALSAAGTLSIGAQADLGGTVSLTSSSITSAAVAATDANPAAAARALSGGAVVLSGTGSTITSTGLRDHGIFVQDAGSQAVVSDTAIAASGSRSNGVLVVGGGAATLTNSSVLTSNLAGAAVQVDTASTVNLTNSSITATTAVGYGVRALGGSSATMTGGSTTTIGRDAAALFAGNSTITASGVAITTTGPDNSMGVLADLGGAITVIGGSVTTTGSSVRDGARPHGVAARNPGGKVSVTGTAILTKGAEGFGVVADDGGSVTLSSLSVRTEDTTNSGPRGAGAIGLFAVSEQAGPQFPASITGTGLTVETLGLLAHGALAQARNDVDADKAAITLNSSSVTTVGAGAVGLRATLADYGLGPSLLRGEAVITANDSTVVTSGVGAHGALARDNPASVVLNNTVVTTSGAVAHGTVAEAGGLIVGNNATVTATGGNAAALYAAGAPTDPAGVSAVSVANFTNSKLTNVSGPTIEVGGQANITLTKSTASGSGQWLRVGTINDFPPLAQVPPVGGIQDPLADADTPLPPPLGAFPLPGALPVVPGLANIILSGSTVIGSAFTAPGSVSNVTLLNNSLWTMTGNSNLTNLINDPSLIQYTPPIADPTLLSSYKTLTVVNYVGQGGIIGLNTLLGNDSSPSDRLVIDGGTASGFSPLRIKNTIGAGDLTVANGILVVDTINGGTTAPGTFALAGPVIAGPYEYTLFRSSVDPTNPQAWYLRSTLDCSGPNAPSPPCPGPALPGPTPPGPTPPGPTPNPPVANFRQEVSLYAALPALTLLYGRNLLDTLHERVGEEEHLRGRTDLSGLPYLNGAWGRVIAQSGSRDGDRAGIFGDGPKYDFDFTVIQAGVDVYRGQLAGYRTHAGFYGALGNGQSDVTHFTGANAGRDSFAAYTGGSYLTLFGPTGWYLDSIAQGTFYDMRGQSTRIPALTTDGWGFGASLETGVPFRGLVGSWTVEPQAQLVYQTVNLGDASDIAAQVRFDDIDSLAGRLGIRFATTWALPAGFWGVPQPALMTGWFRPNYWHEFQGDPRTLFSSATGFIPFRADLGGDWVELNTGISARVDRFTELYANASYQFGVNGDSDAWGGKIALRVNW